MFHINTFYTKCNYNESSQLRTLPFSVRTLFKFHEYIGRNDQKNLFRVAPPRLANPVSVTWHLIPFQFVFIYHPQRSRGKVMFLHRSVILFTGGSFCPRAGWVSVQEVSVQEGSLSRVGSLSRGLSVQKVSVQWVCLTRGFSVHRWVSVQVGSLSRGFLSRESLSRESLSRVFLSRESLSRGSLSGRSPYGNMWVVRILLEWTLVEYFARSVLHIRVFS